MLGEAAVAPLHAFPERWAANAAHATSSRLHPPSTRAENLRQWGGRRRAHFSRRLPPASLVVVGRAVVGAVRRLCQLDCRMLPRPIFVPGLRTRCYGSHAAMRRRGGRLRSSALWLGVPGRFLRRSPPPRRGRRRVVAAGTSAAAVAAAAAPWPSLPQRGRRFGLPKRPGTQRWCLTTACRGAPPLQRGAS